MGKSISSTSYKVFPHQEYFTHYYVHRLFTETVLYITYKKYIKQRDNSIILMPRIYSIMLLYSQLNETIHLSKFSMTNFTTDSVALSQILHLRNQLMLWYLKKKNTMHWKHLNAYQKTLYNSFKRCLSLLIYR